MTFQRLEMTILQQGTKNKTKILIGTEQLLNTVLNASSSKKKKKRKKKIPHVSKWGCKEKIAGSIISYAIARVRTMARLRTCYAISRSTLTNTKKIQPLSCKNLMTVPNILKTIKMATTCSCPTQMTSEKKSKRAFLLLCTAKKTLLSRKKWKVYCKRMIKMMERSTATWSTLRFLRSLLALMTSNKMFSFVHPKQMPVQQSRPRWMRSTE